MIDLRHTMEPAYELPDELSEAPLDVRALFLLRANHPEELCPASLAAPLHTSTSEVIAALRERQRFAYERPMPQALVESAEKDVFFGLRPEGLVELDRFLADRGA